MPEAATIAVLATASATAYSAYESSRQAEKSRSAAKKEAARQRELQEKQLQRELEAGEYFEELSAKQMELQAQGHNINTLAKLIEGQPEPGPRVYTLPAAKTTTPTQQINLAIDKFFRG